VIEKNGFSWQYESYPQMVKKVRMSQLEKNHGSVRRNALIRGKTMPEMVQGQPLQVQMVQGQETAVSKKTMAVMPFVKKIPEKRLQHWMRIVGVMAGILMDNPVDANVVKSLTGKQSLHATAASKTKKTHAGLHANHPPKTVLTAGSSATSLPESQPPQPSPAFSQISIHKTAHGTPHSALGNATQDLKGKHSTGHAVSGVNAGSFGMLQFKMPDMTVQARQAYLIDLSTQTVLFEKNADQVMAPSSMTKIVTVYLILQALSQKSLDWSEKIHISENAAKKPGSRMFIKPNEMIAVLDLLKGIVVTSGNDACTAMAEFLGGSEEGFADMMNDLSLKIGMRDSHFSNASGLPAENHYSTCKDLAKIAERTIVDFPKEYDQFYKMVSFKYNGIFQPNRNVLLKNGFADGMKTGMTDAGKYGIVATAKRLGHPTRRLLLVLNGVETEGLRAAEARKLLNWGFQRFESLVVEKGRVLGQIALWKEGSVSLVTPSRIAVTLPKGSLHRAKMVVRYHQPLTPPIRQNQRLGTLVIDIPGQKTIELPLVAEKDVLAPSMWDAVVSWFQTLVASK